MKCLNCGQENPEGIKFCSLCGTLMPKAPAAATNPTPVSDSAPVSSVEIEEIPVKPVNPDCCVWITDDENFEEFCDWLHEMYNDMEDAEVDCGEYDANLTIDGASYGFCSGDWIVFINDEPKLYGPEEFHQNWKFKKGFGNPGLWDCEYNGSPVLYKLNEGNVAKVAEKVNEGFSYSEAKYYEKENTIHLTFGANSSAAGAGDFLVVFGEDFRVYSSEERFLKTWKIK